LPNTIKYTQDQLTQLTRQKDKVEFGKLYDSYSPALYGVIFRMLSQNQKIAEEVMRDVFVKVWNELETFDYSKETLFIWLLRIARATAQEKLFVLNQDQVQVILEAPDFEKNKAHEFSNTSGTIIDLLYSGKYSLKEISKKMNIPEESVKSHLRKKITDYKTILA
jgi:DNA-directed RNA polymerase specialized sigma24 family protein